MYFETERLIARPWTLHDVDAAYQMYGDPEVMRFLGRNGVADVVSSTEEMREKLAKAIGKYANQSSFVYAALELKPAPKPIGTILLKPLELSSGGPASDEIEIGWHLARSHWQKGLGTEAARAIMQYGFAHLPVSELHAIAYPENLASIRIMQKLGMKHQGSTDRYYGVTTEHYLIER
jgi:RimJ/RimL family protein N-acetyltransferase